jgi:predicted glycogen debranching enzyme
VVTASADLECGGEVALVLSAGMGASPSHARAFRERDQIVIEAFDRQQGDVADAVGARLALAADDFLVRRDVAGQKGASVIAGYPWFGDWGRDTMIALPGLTLATGRAAVARTILLTYARFLDRGMLPNRFPDVGHDPEYNTADATLWYVEAVRAYCAETNDLDLARDLWPVLEDIVAHHERGTRHGIGVDARDGLLYAGEQGVQLTWMDAKVGDWVVTPRTGKCVEINALWYNALLAMGDLAERLGGDRRTWEERAARVRVSFDRFWSDADGHLLDVIDGPNGDDHTLRPNQIFAVSLPASPLGKTRQRAVVDTCARSLVTSHGLRSLAPRDPRYRPQYGGDQTSRDSGYHQGAVWAWLLGPFALAHFRVYGDARLAGAYLEPLVDHLRDAGVGSVSEIFDGAPIHRPDGCVAQAWSVAETLRAWTWLRRAADSGTASRQAAVPA